MEKENKNKTILILKILIGIVLCLMIGILIYSAKKNEIPKDYIAVFVGENDRNTYLYKLENDPDEYKYSYICTVKKKVVKKGRANWHNDIYTLINDHKSTSYVQINGDDKQYTVDEYMDKLLTE